MKTLKFKNHLSQIFRIQSIEAPWPQMALCALATALPLLVGELRGQVAVSVYGSLAGFLVALNDHLGGLKHRLLVISGTFLLLIGAIALSLFWKDHPLLFQATIVGLIYWVGLMGNEGGELERGALFAVMTMVIMIYATSILVPYMDAIFTYSLIGFLSILVGAPLLEITKKWQPASHATLLDSFRKALTRKWDRHVHAFCYALTGFASLYLSNYFHWDRGYWVTITMLLVMKKDPKTSVYVTLQRLIGTLLGVIVCDLLGVVSPTVMVVSVAFSAFLIPWYSRRSYWITTFLITILVLFLLDLAFSSQASHLADLRLVATFWGCLLSLAGTALSKVLLAARSKIPLE